MMLHSIRHTLLSATLIAAVIPSAFATGSLPSVSFKPCPTSASQINADKQTLFSPSLENECAAVSPLVNRHLFKKALLKGLSGSQAFSTSSRCYSSSGAFARHRVLWFVEGQPVFTNAVRSNEASQLDAMLPHVEQLDYVIGGDGATFRRARTCLYHGAMSGDFFVINQVSGPLTPHGITPSRTCPALPAKTFSISGSTISVSGTLMNCREVRSRSHPKVNLRCEGSFLMDGGRFRVNFSHFDIVHGFHTPLSRRLNEVLTSFRTAYAAARKEKVAFISASAPHCRYYSKTSPMSLVSGGSINPVLNEVTGSFLP